MPNFKLHGASPPLVPPSDAHAVEYLSATALKNIENIFSVPVKFIEPTSRCSKTLNSGIDSWTLRFHY